MSKPDVATTRMLVAAFVVVAVLLAGARLAWSQPREVGFRVNSKSWVKGSTFDLEAFRSRCLDAGVELVASDRAAAGTPAIVIDYEEARGSGFSPFGVGNPVGWGTDIEFSLKFAADGGKKPALTIEEKAETPAGLELEQFHGAAREALARSPAFSLACSAVAGILGDREQLQRLQPWAVFDRRAVAILSSAHFTPSSDEEQAYDALARREFERLSALGEAAAEPLILLLENTVENRGGYGVFTAISTEEVSTLTKAIGVFAGLDDEERTRSVLTTFLNDHSSAQTEPDPPVGPAVIAALRALGSAGTRFTLPFLQEWSRGTSVLAREAQKAAAAVRQRIEF